MASVEAHRADLQASRTASFGGGAIVGVLGGLVGLGGAEFRLPLLIGPFRFPPLEAIILNKAMSLIVVAFALVFRTRAAPLYDVVSHTSVIVNLLAGSLLGAWCGASLATRLHSRTLYRLIAVLLAVIAAILFLGEHEGAAGAALAGVSLWLAGALAGFAIGVVASLLGVAGGELLIPTCILLFGVDIKIAGTLSLAVSLPTMIVGFARYSRDESFAVLYKARRFAALMAAGSIVGALTGSLLLGSVPESVLYPVLAVILLLSAVKVWRYHGEHRFT